MEQHEYTSREVASRLAVHVKTVNRWCRAGRLPGAALRLNSRRLGYRIPAGLVDLLAQGGDVRSDGSLQPPQAGAGGAVVEYERAG